MVANDVAAPLTGPEVILVTKADSTGTDPTGTDPNAATGLLVKSGSVITAAGGSPGKPVAITIGQNADSTTANSTTGAAAVSGDGALLAVSNGGPLQISRNDLPAAAQGLLTVEGGVTLAGGQGLTLDAAGNTRVDPSATLSGQAIVADSGLITFVAGSAAPSLSGPSLSGPSLSGMVIGAATLAQFATASQVILRSYGAIDFEGGIAIDVPNRLTLSAGAFTSGAAGHAGNVSIHAGVLTLSNDLSAPAPAAPVAGASGLTLTADEIDFGTVGQGAGTAAFSGFGTVKATAANGIVGQGAGTFDFGALPVTLTAPVIVAGAGGNATLKTTGALVLNAAPAAGATSAAGAFGGAITLIGGAVADNTLIQVPAGNVTLDATTGDLAVNANVDVSGFAKQFFDTAAYAPAGNIVLKADAGTVTVASGVVLDFAGAAAGGTAGAVTLSAPKGAVNLAGTLEGGALPGYQGGSFTLDTGGAVNLDTLAATLASSGVNTLISVTTGTGNLVLSAGNTLRAANVLLTANGGASPNAGNGNLVIDGVIDVSGPAAGEIALYGRSGVDIEGSLLARSATPAQAGGVVVIGTTGTPDGTLNATYGYENVQAADSGTIHVGPAAVIDVSGGAGALYGGTISFRAPLLANGDVKIGIDSGATLTGARTVTIEPYAVWSTTDASTDAAKHFDGIIDPSGYYQDGNGGAPQYVSGTWVDASGNILQAPTDAATLASYQSNDYFVPDTANADHQTFYGYVGGNSANGPGTLMAYVETPGYSFGNRYAGIANAQVAPGIVLENPDLNNNKGAISVLTNWNLGAGTDDGQGHVTQVFRYNGAAPVLSVLAAGNLNIKASITDGFYQQNGGVGLADPIAAPTSSYNAALDAYNGVINYLVNGAFYSGDILWTGTIYDQNANLLADISSNGDPYFQQVQAPLQNQAQAYYNNYMKYMADFGSGQNGTFAYLYNWGDEFGFKGYTNPATEAVTATAPQPSNFASYAQYARAYQTWLAANFNATTTNTPPPLLQPTLNGSYYTAYSSDYAVYAGDYLTYINYVAFQTGNITQQGVGSQLFYAPFAPYAEPGKLPGNSAYDQALQNYNAALGLIAQYNINLTGLVINLNGGGTANIAADPYYKPLQAPLENQSSAYYANYEGYITQWGQPSNTGWIGIFNRQDQPFGQYYGWLGYKPTDSDPNVPVAPQPINYPSYAAYAAAYYNWLQGVYGYTILLNTQGHPDTPSPLLLPLDNGTYANYSSDYAQYITDWGTYYSGYVSSERWNSTFPFIYPPYAPASNPATVILPNLGTLPVVDFGPNNNPDNQPVAGNPIPLYAATLLGGSSSSYRLVAGANFTSADPLAVNPGSTGSVNLDGHLTVADTATKDLDGNPLSSDFISGRTLLFPTTVRTGTGSIDIAAAGDVDWLDTAAPAAVYTAGEPAPGTTADTSASVLRPSTSSAYQGELLVTGPVQPVNAGNITISAGRNINGIEQVYDTTGNVTGTAGTYVAQFWWQWMETNNVTNSSGQVTQSSINFAAFDQGVMSAGGNVSVTAKGDIRELSVALPTTWNISNGAVNTLGGGNLAVSAGGDILGGAYFVANGAGSLTAGGEIGSAFTLSTTTSGIAGAVSVSTPMAPLLGYQNTNWTVTARQDANIGGVYDPSYFSLFGIGAGDSQSPSSTSSLSILSTVGNAKLGTMTASNAPFLGSTDSGTLLPASLSMTALGGGIEIDNAGELYPSVNGQLTLLADQSISFADDVAGGSFFSRYFGLLDVDPSLLPSPLNQQSQFYAGIGATDPLQPTSSGLPRYEHTISHAQNANPVRVYALNGNITDGAQDSLGFYYDELVLEPNKPAFIQAGNDIVNLSFLGENFYASDVTRIVAGHDIYDPVLGTAPLTDPRWANYLTPALELAGPGYFDIQAGRNIGPLTSANQSYLVFQNGAGGSSLNGTIATGIETIGDLDNAALPAESAHISILFGVGKGINDTGFAATYIDPAAAPIPGIPNLSPQLVAYVEQIAADSLKRSGGNGGIAPLTPDEAWTLFETLPQYQQQAFIDRQFFAVLTQVGADYNNPASPYYHQYIRGYQAINTLFPASDGYTQNNLEGGTNGANQLVGTGYFDMRGATVQTQEGGNIDILGPGGRILVGSASAPPYVVDSNGDTVIGPNQQGILTLETGNVSIFSDQSLLLAQSRIFTEQGGEMTIWSSNGDINAGEGAKTTSDVPPPLYKEDPDGYFTVDAKSEVTGAGIATLQTIPGAPRGNVYLIAPRGTVDAGAAGIRVSGDLAIAALHVENAFNIQVQGTAFGIPTAVAPNLGALTTASNAAGAAATAAEAAGRTRNRSTAQDLPSIITVEVLGYGGGDATPTQQPQKGDQRKKNVQQSYDTNSAIQVVGYGGLTPLQRQSLTDEEKRKLWQP
ncbi:filamentous haemagglutinin family protein [Aliidongia dinghuensis]|uniref:filamentous haemagglutinin family protein n=1 Tax=Aliidongia dinghuensis TaxID=1867774 RepID=UPI001E47FA47|nr:filamentous haemagglutinin family protein [Aliidongia dinghuensis]